MYVGKVRGAKTGLTIEIFVEVMYLRLTLTLFVVDGLGWAAIL